MSYDFNKTCFKCKQVFSLDEFYTHPRMADGHLNKCKTCTKADTAARVAKKSQDPIWIEQEIERCRLKMRKARANRKYVFTPEQNRDKDRKYRAKYPEKHQAKLLVRRAIQNGSLTRCNCQICDNPDSEAHHEDYSKPLEVIWLCPKHHAERHVEKRRQDRLINQAIKRS